MDRLLRKKDVVEAIGMAKSTVSDWITEFQVFIPTVKQGSVTYYLPESIEVLNAIKELREANYTKADIMTMLSDRGFPITVEESAKDLEHIIKKTDYRDGLLNLLETMGQAVNKIGEQNERRLERHENRLDEQDQQMKEMIQQMDLLRKELAATQEALESERNKGFLRKLFKR